MFDNIGGKIKGLAKTVCYLGIAISIIIFFGLYILAGEAYYNFLQIVYMIGAFTSLLLGSAISYLSALALYGFGELIEKTTEIANNTRCQNNIIKDKKQNANELLGNGLIAQEEKKF